VRVVERHPPEVATFEPMERYLRQEWLMVHFGHVHYRQNRYDAAVHILAVDGGWKIREIEVLDERRLL
jgi:hypothetical protein